MKPRIQPLDRREADPRVEIYYQQMDKLGKSPPNAHLTFGKNPDLYEKWFPFATYITPASSLEATDRQILVLRSAFNWRCGYLWAQHADLSKRISALSDSEIGSLAQSDLSTWDDRECALVQACDDTRQNGQIANACWQILDEHFTEKELLDIVFTIGQYALISTCVKSLKITLDDDLTLPDWAE